ncbi:MAG: TCP-1/cpn60 chaperonin family protein [Armatimonadetes bacterium]|nr:TCP-1/cpn60 chaperonin family protein [Armatimonadota bacterium]
MTTLKSSGGKADGDERFAALLNNAGAVRAVASSVEGTLGAKGLNCMLVDRFGNTTITNDGSTILDRMDAAHPAARLLIHAAKAQEKAVGDGTTTTVVLANALIQEGAAQIVRGVPAAKVIEGLRLGVDAALAGLKSLARPVSSLKDPRLLYTARVAARSQHDIAALVLEAARLVGAEQLADPAFRLQDLVRAEEGAANEVIAGLLLSQTRLNRLMPLSASPARLLLIDDALEPEPVKEGALSTESGFARYLENERLFRQQVAQILDTNVQAVLAARNIHEIAEEAMTAAGIIAFRRVSARDMFRVAVHTGARLLKRGGLNRSAEEIEAALGRAERIEEDERLEFTRIEGGSGRPTATILVGAATAEVKEERERIARDGASAAQYAFAEGVLPGGGAAELAAISAVRRRREAAQGMAIYGIDCVLESLKRPAAQMTANAGFNPLEKVEEAMAAQSREANPALAIDLDTGQVADMERLEVIDPLRVKQAALKTAAEVAEAILSIQTVLRRREGPENAPESPAS